MQNGPLKLAASVSRVVGDDDSCRTSGGSSRRKARRRGSARAACWCCTPSSCRGSSSRRSVAGSVVGGARNDLAEVGVAARRRARRPAASHRGCRSCSRRSSRARSGRSVWPMVDCGALLATVVEPTFATNRPTPAFNAVLPVPNRSSARRPAGRSPSSAGRRCARNARPASTGWPAGRWPARSRSDRRSAGRGSS